MRDRWIFREDVRKSAIRIALLALLGGSSGAFGGEHVVLPAENLSRIASRYFTGRVFGRHGGLAKLLAMNPRFASHPDFIRAGEVLSVPASLPIAQREVASEPIRAPRREPAPTPVAVEPEPIIPPPRESAPPVPAPVASPAPSPIPAPVATPNAKLVETETPPPTRALQLTRFGLSPVLSFSRMDGTDSSTGVQAVIVSDPSFGIQLRWEQEWRENWVSALRFQLGRERYSIGSSTRTLSPSEFLSIGTAFEVGKRGSIFTPTLTAGFDRRAFLESSSSTALILHGAILPFAGVAVRAIPVGDDSDYFGVRFSWRYLFAGSVGGVQIRSGSAIGIEPEIAQEISNRTLLILRGSFDRESQDTQLQTQSRIRLGLAAEIQWRWAPSRSEPKR